MKKKVLSVLMAIMMLIVCVAPVFGLSQVRVRVNGRQVVFPDGQPYIDENSRVMVPVRFVSEQLGAKVDWDKSAMRVTIVDNEKEVYLTIGNKKVMVNGKVKTLDTAAVLRGTRTYVPLRFVSEALGANVRWDGKVRIAYIDNGKAPLVDEEIYEAGPFSFVVQPDWVVSETSDSWSLRTNTLMCIRSDETGMELGNYITLLLEQGMIVPYSDQCDEAEQILQQALSTSKAKEIVNYARKKKGRVDALAEKKFYEGNYIIIVAAEGEAVIIDVNQR